MQRFFALLALFVLSIPVGLSITGCRTNLSQYCNGAGYGPKTNQVAAIDLEPKTTGISLSWGQTSQLKSPVATACGKAGGATVSVPNFNYGSTNLYLADVSPTGAVCAGTWNRNSPGGIADYTICTPPAGSSNGTCTSTSCGVVNMTAAAAGVSSNPVPVYVHPPITSISFAAGAANSPDNACFSQNTPGPVLSPAGSSPNVTVLGPNGYVIPSAYVGTITYSPVNATIVSINNTSVSGTGVNGATTANLPGSTVVNASVSLSSSGSAAGYFYTCPPATISLSLDGSTTGPVSVTPSAPQNIAATITDTKGKPITGLQLDYVSTEPENIGVSPLGQVTATWPGDTSISAICQPATCNPAPLSQIGMFGTGTPVVSNTLNVTSPGTNSNLLWMASTQSQFFSSIDLTTGTPGTPIKLPYFPNSMVTDQASASLYFGSYRELMIYSTSTNALATQDTSVPGVVLAVSPTGSTVVINDQIRQVIYLWASKGGIQSSIAGVATRATFSPDGKNIYVVGPNALYVFNVATGWSTYSSAATPIPPTTPPGPTTQVAATSCNFDNNTPGSGTYDPFCGPGLALTVPSIGPFVSGSPTSAWGFCPAAGVAGLPVYYPQAASIGVQTEQLAATNSGQHILGADPNVLSDINVAVPTGMCPSTLPGNSNGNTAQIGIKLSPTFTQAPFGFTASEIDQVVTSPTSDIAFVTYNNNNQSAGTGLLPAYSLSASAGSPGTLTNIQLSGAAKSPISGIFSPNTTLFFVGTSGDNLVHFINPTTLTDTKTINPGLVDGSGNPVPVQMMAVKPRSTT